MLHDAFAHLEREIQAGKIQVALLELFDDAKRVQIMVEVVAVLPHAQVQLLFACVTEGRMTYVVYQGQSLGKLGIQPQRVRNGARNLRDLYRVRQTIAKVVGVTRGENLRLGFQATKGTGGVYGIGVPAKIPPIGL